MLSRIGQLAYKLDLPASCKIYPVFHVSQLKKALPPSQTSAPLADSLDGLHIPLKILQKRIAIVGVSVVPQVLVQWSGLPIALATCAWGQRFPYG